MKKLFNLVNKNLENQDNLRRSTRDHKVSVFLQDYHYQFIDTRYININNATHSISSNISYEKWSLKQLHYTLNISINNEP